MGISISGLQIGNIVSMPIVGYLCVDGFDGGWPSIFYIFGALGILFSIFLFAMVSESPTNQKCISEKERKYIVDNCSKISKPPVSLLGLFFFYFGFDLIVRIFSTHLNECLLKKNTPWMKMFTSKVVLGTNVCAFAFNWGLYLYITQIPSYIKDVLKFDIKSVIEKNKSRIVFYFKKKKKIKKQFRLFSFLKNGKYSAMPYLFCSIVMITTSFIGDYLIANEIRSRLAVRKIFTCICRPQFFKTKSNFFFFC